MGPPGVLGLECPTVTVGACQRDTEIHDYGELYYGLAVWSDGLQGCSFGDLAGLSLGSLLSTASVGSRLLGFQGC